MADVERQEIVDKFPEEYRHTNDDGVELLKVEEILKEQDLTTGDKPGDKPQPESQETL